ncbi:MAG: plastocyanin/azurin family copper-binding protein [Candidatus Saccharibacteria bacterium]
MKKVLPIIIVILILAVGGAIYFASKSNTSTTSTAPASLPKTSTSTPQAAPPQAVDKVAITNFTFSPVAITVKKGTTVTWTNNDSVNHTVTETDGLSGPKSSSLATGQSYTFTFTTAGAFHYNCSIHPNMVGTVTVTE